MKQSQSQLNAQKHMDCVLQNLTRLQKRTLPDSTYKKQTPANSGGFSLSKIILADI